MQYRNDGSREEYQIQNQFTAYLQVALKRRKMPTFLSVTDSNSMNDRWNLTGSPSRQKHGKMNTSEEWSC